jgi:hypothetical protein
MPRTRPPVRGEILDAAHHRREAGDDAGPDVVAVGEAARQDDGRDAVQVRRLVPERDRLDAGDRRALSESTSELEPGKVTTPIFTAPAPSNAPTMSLEQLDGVRPRSAGCSAALWRGRRPRRASASEAAVTVSSTRRRREPCETLVTWRWGRLSSTARPWGSRMPGLGRTLTAYRNSLIGRSHPPAGSARSWPR